VPRDATDTRTRLLDEAERLFAVEGIDRAATRDITVAAGQRNASALTYHFGSRSGVLAAILARHDADLDAQRGRLVGADLAGETVGALVSALTVPYLGCLAVQSGRHYLRIVDQLTSRFVNWGTAELNGTHLQAILAELQRRCPGPPEEAAQRVVGAIMLLTAAAADRARRIDAGERPAVGHDRFVAVVSDMVASCLSPPVPVA
jgi:AcrR family transcriptional regulator